MEDWKDPREIEYFELEEFADKIKLSDNVLYHLDEVRKSFEDYLKLLKNAVGDDAASIIWYWLDQGEEELLSSGKIERHTFQNQDLLKSDIFFDDTKINQERIKRIHKFVCDKSETATGILQGEYRKTPVWVGTTEKYDPTKKISNGAIIEDGMVKDIHWMGAQPQDIPNFMKALVNMCSINSLKTIYSDPFLRSALVHLLLVRIQPFGDGNRRTARVLHNLTFTKEINKYFGTKLKLSPVNISRSILEYQPDYAERINHIKFNINDDNNEEMNRWFDYILRRYEDQFFYQENRISELENSRKFITEKLLRENNEYEEIAEQVKLKKLFESK